MDESILSFAFAEEETVEVIDRSSLECFVVCPAQAVLLKSGRVLNESVPMQVGNAVHDAFSATVQRYIDEYPEIRLSEIADAAFAELRCSRPDIQPQALDAGKASIWAWAKMLANHSAANILRFDGGEGDKCSQLSWDVPMGDVTLRLTSELDLLLTTPSKSVLREIDYKSGWKRYGLNDVADSFQFGMHAWLVLQNYPEVEALEVQVWQTRTNNLTYPVTFDRARFKEINTRIQSAAGFYSRYRNSEPSAVPTWPEITKCSLCPAAALCPASLHLGEIAADPAGFVDAMVALDARLTAMQKAAAEYVDAHGDIVTPSGAAFGRSKPVKPRKATAVLYTTKTKGDSDDGVQDQ